MKLAKSSLSARTIIEKLLTIQNGKVAVQVTMANYTDMIAQAKMLAVIDSRIISEFRLRMMAYICKIC